MAVEGQMVDDPPADGARVGLVFQEPLAGRPGDIRGQEGGQEGVRLAGREFGLNFRRQGSGRRPRQALLPEGGGQGDRIRGRVTPGQGLQGPVHDHPPEPGRVAIGSGFGFRPGGGFFRGGARLEGKLT